MTRFIFQLDKIITYKQYIQHQHIINDKGQEVTWGEINSHVTN